MLQAQTSETATAPLRPRCSGRRGHAAGIAEVTVLSSLATTAWAILAVTAPAPRPSGRGAATSWSSADGWGIVGRPCPTSRLLRSARVADAPGACAVLPMHSSPNWRFPAATAAYGPNGTAYPPAGCRALRVRGGNGVSADGL